MITKSVRVQSVRIVINILNKRVTYNEVKKERKNENKVGDIKEENQKEKKNKGQNYYDEQIEKIIRNGGL